MIITLLGEMESKKCVCACARACGTVWRVVSGLRGVLIGPLIVWNRTNKCVRFFSWWVSRRGGGALFQVFQQSENAFDLGVEMLFVRVSLGKMNTRDVW